MSVDSSSLPLALRVVDPAMAVEVDVREELRAGREPFGRIMAALATVPNDGALVVRAIFDPVPLHRVMAKQGFVSHTETLAPDDWRVWFYRDVRVLDVREMEPPEPLAYTLAALEELPPGASLVQVNVRVPRLLLTRLEELRIPYEVRTIGPAEVHVRIRRDNVA